MSLGQANQAFQHWISIGCTTQFDQLHFEVWNLVENIPIPSIGTGICTYIYHKNQSFI